MSADASQATRSGAASEARAPPRPPPDCASGTASGVPETAIAESAARGRLPTASAFMCRSRAAALYSYASPLVAYQSMKRSATSTCSSSSGGGAQGVSGRAAPAQAVWGTPAPCG